MRSRKLHFLCVAILVGTLNLLVSPASWSATNQILAWNNLGMHCMDSDYSVFSVLPPYNTIEAQLIVGGKLVTNGSGYTVTYQAVADPTGSFNSTALGKGNYYSYVQALYGAALAAEGGLAGWNMPGTNNPPLAMLFEPTNHPAAGVATPVNWWRAEGIPITPYDDAHNKNPYPMMRLIAKSGTTPIATNDIVLPVSDEMDCRACHASGTQASAEPAAGWAWDGLPERDFRLNILRLHDEKNFSQHGSLYNAALAARGFNPQGLYRGVVADNQPVLCAACHASEALGAPSYSTIPPLTASVHSFHAHVMDPISILTLDSSANRSACYRCHPGSTTKCLRGAMGGAVAADGSMSMQCQSCHGNMSTVGAASRVGWFMEPNCASCHTGTATSNNGQIRYASVFTDTNFTVRVPGNPTFSTQPNIPANGISLFRFSAGHGGLQCEACHGSTHAEFPSTHENDNVRNLKIQGHTGMMVECTACHTSMSVSSTTAAGGPHGMHPIGQSWVSGHHDFISSMPGGVAACQACHGLDFRGTVLSRVQATRTLTANFDAGTVTLNLYRGATIGCYSCHNGPANDNLNTNAVPMVNNVFTNTTNDKSVAMTLPATGTGLTLRIISQPANGSVGLSGNVATYYPNPGFIGTDTFDYAAYNGSKNSNLATGTVAVAQGPVAITAVGHVPASYPAGWPVAFAVVPAVSNSAAPVTFDWDFDDGTPHSTNQFPTHTYQSPGFHVWTVTATVSGKSAVDAGIIVVDEPVNLTASHSDGAITILWPDTSAGTILEATDTLGPNANWVAVTNAVASSQNNLTVTVPAVGNKFFRVRQSW
jgi:PKD repeat protein